jgi:hypothetical protein
MAHRHPHVRLGTRGSPLALWQARWVAYVALCLAPSSPRKPPALAPLGTGHILALDGL